MNTNSNATALYRAFLACLVVASLPIKNFAYVAPALYLLILLLSGEYRLILRVALLSSVIFIVSCVAMTWDHLGGREVNFPGLLLGMITHAPLIIVLCESFNRTIDQALYDKFANVCAWFILFQSVVGLTQFAATVNGDAVCGTFGLLDGFRQTITIAQVYFTFTIFGMILFLVPVANRWLPRVAIASGALICLLAQSGHQTIFFVGTLLICGLARFSHLGKLARTGAAAAVMFVLLLQFYPDTITMTRDWFHKVTDTTNSPKRLALEGASSTLKEPKNLLIGTGLGQYCSRAALITSNEYLTLELPWFMTGKSDYFTEHIHPALLLFDESGEGSAIAKPYMSALSLPVELGLVICLVLVAAICQVVAWSVKVMINNDGQLGWIGFAMTAGILFFVLCCFIENYAEFSQAVFVPFVLFVAAGSRAQTLLRLNESSVGATRLGALYKLTGLLRPRFEK